MSRGSEPDDAPEDERPEPPGHVGTTRAGTLVGFALTGLVLGWLLRPVSIQISGTAPLVGWLPVLALFSVALVVAAAAWSTYRSLHRRRDYIEPHRAVNRLVLAKSCAMAGALIAGGYLGYALSYWGIAEAELAEQRVLQSLLAAAAAVLTVIGSLLLERACRISRDDDPDLR